MSGLSILFYGKKSKTTTDNLLPVYMRVTIDGDRFEISTKRYIDKTKWCAKSCKLKGNTEEARSFNQFLESLRSKVYQCQYDHHISKGMLTHITTNLSATEIENTYGSRVRSRMREMFNLIAFDKEAEDKRR